MIHALVQGGKLISGAENDADVPWWSFTKTVIAAAALALVRDGLLTLDHPIEGQAFTLRQLLRHQTGLPDYGALPDYHRAVGQGESAWPEAELLERVEATRLRYAPGHGWAYSNIGYLYVRHLIERRTGEEFGVALQRLVLRPLGLTQARLARTAQDLGGVQMGRRHAYDPAWVYHGLLVGPLHEAALLLDRLLAGTLLPPDLGGAMLDQHCLGEPIAGRPWVSPGYGLGLMVGEAAGGFSIAGHTGGGPGSVIAVYHHVGAQGSVSCAAFAAGEDADAVERDVVRRLGGDGHW